MLRKISHIGIAVSDLEGSVRLYRDVLGLEFLGFEEVTDQQVRVAMFRIGESRIELLEPTADDSPVARFLASRGPGMHHICFEVDDVGESLRVAAASGVRLIDSETRDGAGGMKIGFLHPAGTGGVLIELNSHDLP